MRVNLPNDRADVGDWHAMHAADAVAAMDSNAASGLTPEAARGRLERFGANALGERQRRSLIGVFVRQFKSPLIYLLFVAAGIALALGNVRDAIVIFTVVLLNAVIGGFQEGRAERSLEALRKLTTHKVRAVRAGHEIIVDARELVPGDVLVVEAGDAIAADARLLDGAALQIAEAALTGESVPVDKSFVPLAPDAPLADRCNMVYAGTHVTAGRARCLVIATGMATEIGRIAALAEESKEQQTPLQRRIAQFGKYIIAAATVMFVVVNVIGVLRGIPLADILMLAISQVVGMVPEGLPVAMTIALAVGVQRMARRNAVVRRLAAVETLGSTTVICSDKTGTLTRNEMTATAVYLPTGRILSVTGAGYEPVGQFLDNGAVVDPTREDSLRALLEAAILCNDAQLQGPENEEPRWRPIGDPTEVALLTLGMKGAIVPDELRARHRRRAEIPFDPAEKMMATQHDTRQGSVVVIKGAPEVLFELCRRPDADAEQVASDELARASAERMAASALRVLAFAAVEGATVDGRAGFAALRGRAVLLGLVGQMDPPRSEVKDAVARCSEAGIKVVMVTGDHKTTGFAVAKSLGITGDGEAVVDGRELEQMSAVELARRIDDVSVFARVHPAQKLRIVNAYQEQQHVVAMTGDGVNDAPALVKADVGVAMGMSGTAVAKEAAKIVINDDNFATIVAAIEEGRVVYRNIKKVILYLFSTSMAEVLVLVTALELGYPPPLAAVQILWINLVTEGTVTVNLIMEPAEGDEMCQKPIASNEPLLTRVMLVRMAFMTPAIAASTLGWFVYRLSLGVPFPQVQTETFTMLALCQWYNVINCRSTHQSAFRLSLLKNPWLIGGLVVSALLQAAVVFFAPLGAMFHTVPFTLNELIGIAAVASSVLWTEELRKLVARRTAMRAA